MGKDPCSNCGQRSCNGIDCYYKDDPEPSLEDKFTALTARLAELEGVCGEAYQLAGAAGASVEALDNLSAASSGRPIPHKTFLPVLPDELREVKEVNARLAEAKKLLRRILDPAQHPPEPFYDTLLAITAFFTPKGDLNGTSKAKRSAYL